MDKPQGITSLIEFVKTFWGVPDLTLTPEQGHELDKQLQRTSGWRQQGPPTQALWNAPVGCLAFLWKNILMSDALALRSWQAMSKP
jgi:hypothetical protein